MLAEKINHQAHGTFGDFKLHPFRLAGEHVQVLVNIFLQIEPLFQAHNLASRFHRRIQHFDIHDPVNPVVGYVFMPVIVADQIIPALAGQHLVGIQHLPFFAAVRSPGLMQLQIRSVITVGDPDLFSVGNGLVQHVNGVKQLRILGRIRRHAVHVVHPLVEIGAGQLPQLIDQLSPLLIGHGAGEQQTVDQHPEFGFRKVVLIVQIRVDNVFFPLPRLLIHVGAHNLRVLNIIPGVNQVGDIPLHGRPVHIQSVIILQLLRDLLLGHGMVEIRIFPQDLQNIQNDDFLSAFRHHPAAPPLRT